jgi:electron transfer flavoprotein beta subunit
VRTLKIIVCIKQVPDPEGPASAFQVESEAKKVVPVGIGPVINPFDENALEAALQIKDSVGAKVVAMSMIEKPLAPVLRKALAVGVDELIVLQDERFEDLDCYSTSYVLSSAIKKIGAYDLILVGRQAADWNFGQTGPLISEFLQVPCVSTVQRVRVDDGKVVAEKLKRRGYEIVRASMPALITLSSEIGDLRYASVNRLRDARQKPVTVWSSIDLKIDFHMLNVKKIYRLLPPASRERECIFIEGQSPHEKGERLALKLRQDKVL